MAEKDEKSNVIDVKVYESLVKEKTALMDIIGTQDTLLESYKTIGTVEEINAALSKAKAIVENLTGVDISKVKPALAELESYRQIGGVEDINKAIDHSFNIIEAYTVLGSPMEIDVAMNKSNEFFESYKELGTAAEINAALDQCKEMLEAYQKLGTIDEVSKVMDHLESNITKSKCESIASKYNKPTSLIQSMFEKVGSFKVVEELLEEGFATGKKKSINESQDGKRDLMGSHESIISRVIRTL